jgi:hypothetical protein
MIACLIPAIGAGFAGFLLGMILMSILAIAAEGDRHRS